MAEFDPKRVTPIEWAGVGAGAAAFLFSFFPWYSVSFDGPGLGFGVSTSGSAWEIGIGGWLPVLLLVAAAVLLLLPHFGKPVPNRERVWLGLAAGALVVILIRWLTLPGDSGLGGFGGEVDAGAGFGLILGLLAAAVSTAAAFLTFQAARKRVV